MSSGTHNQAASTGRGQPVEPDYLAHATTWFTHHAGQRLQSFNFFAVFQAGLSVAIVQFWGDPGQQFVIALVGIVTAASFYVLEVRNAALVAEGRLSIVSVVASLRAGTSVDVEHAIPILRDLKRRTSPGDWTPWPTQLASQIDSNDRGVLHIDATGSGRGDVLLTHTFILRTLMALALALWIGVAGVSVGMNASDSATHTNRPVRDGRRCSTQSADSRSCAP